ncbi:MAG: HAD-IA family hydrolase [Spirochaetales bacterium]|nr:HAD-IA family hydrolase [Spirochaetales bacterium]
MSRLTDDLTAPRAVVFDLDGTLLDTLADIATAMNYALASTGYPESPIASYTTRVGWGMRRLIELSLPSGEAIDGSLLDELSRLTREYYARHPADHTRPYPGIPDVLRALDAAEMPMAILSNKPDDLTQLASAAALSREALTVPGDRPLFEVIRGQIDGVPRKPDPTSLYAILRTLAVDPGDVAFVGDSEVDMETARTAGCIPVAVAWGFRTPEAVAAAGATHMCYSAEELGRVLGVY